MKRLPRTLYGFSCYSRTLSQEVNEGHAKLVHQLRLVLTPDRVSVYQDTHPETGQQGGNWLRTIATELARSGVLFWWQHAEWFTKAVSRWELECFRKRIEFIEHALGAPPGSLAYQLVVPIPLGQVSDAQWSRLPDEAGTLRSFYTLLNRLAPFMDELATGHAPPFADKTYDRAMRKLEENLEATLSPYGGIAALMAVPDSGPAFVDEWVAEAYRRKLEHGEPEPAAEISVAARRQLHGRRLARALAHVPDGGHGFLVTALVEQADGFGPEPADVDPAGRPRWTAAAALDLEDDVRAEGLRLPTMPEAERIMALVFAPREARRACGLEDCVRTFWVREPGDAMPVPSTGTGPAAIFLVIEEPR